MYVSIITPGEKHVQTKYVAFIFIELSTTESSFFLYFSLDPFQIIWRISRFCHGCLATGNNNLTLRDCLTNEYRLIHWESLTIRENVWNWSIYTKSSPWQSITVHDSPWQSILRKILLDSSSCANKPIWLIREAFKKKKIHILRGGSARGHFPYVITEDLKCIESHFEHF